MRKFLNWGLAAAFAVSGCTASRTVIVTEKTTPPPPAVQSPGLETASRVHTRNGIRFYERGQYRKAIQQFELATAKDPSNWEAHFYLGECYRELRDWDRCMTHYQRVEELHQTDPVWVAKVQFSIGLVCEGRENFEEARAHYERALAAVPDYGPAVEGRARVAVKKYRDQDDNRHGKGRRYNYKDKNN